MERPPGAINPFTNPHRTPAANRHHSAHERVRTSDNDNAMTGEAVVELADCVFLPMYGALLFPDTTEGGEIRTPHRMVALDGAVARVQRTETIEKVLGVIKNVTNSQRLNPRGSSDLPCRKRQAGSLRVSWPPSRSLLRQTPSRNHRSEPTLLRRPAVPRRKGGCRRAARLNEIRSRFLHAH